MFLYLHDLLYAISVHVFDGHTSELMLYKKLAYGKVPKLVFPLWHEKYHVNNLNMRGKSNLNDEM